MDVVKVPWFSLPFRPPPLPTLPALHYIHLYLDLWLLYLRVCWEPVTRTRAHAHARTHKSTLKLSFDLTVGWTGIAWRNRHGIVVSDRHNGCRHQFRCAIAVFERVPKTLWNLPAAVPHAPACARERSIAYTSDITLLLPPMPPAITAFIRAILNATCAFICGHSGLLITQPDPFVCVLNMYRRPVPCVCCVFAQWRTFCLVVAVAPLLRAYTLLGLCRLFDPGAVG